jgi:hypothetical protein
MSSVLPDKDVDQFQHRIQEITAQVNEMQVTNDTEATVVNHALHEVKILKATIIQFIEPFRVATRRAYDETLARKNALVKPLEVSETALKELLADYDTKRELELRDAHTKALAAAKEEAKKDHDAKIEAAIDRGDEMTAEKLMQQKPTLEPKHMNQPVPAPPPALEGTHYRTRWIAECEDIITLCRAISQGEVPADLVKLDQSKANKLAAALKEQLNRIDCGLLAVPRKDVAVR